MYSPVFATVSIAVPLAPLSLEMLRSTFKLVFSLAWERMDCPPRNSFLWITLTANNINDEGWMKMGLSENRSASSPC